MHSLARCFWLFALLLASSISAAASAQDRTALVIANFDYGEHQLARVSDDAAAVGEALRREGFRVTIAENVSFRELRSTIERFARSTATRGVAMLYFAGLGGQYQASGSQGAWWTHVQGAGKPADPRSPERDSLALPEIVKLFAGNSSARANWLVLDAARPNPFLAERPDHPPGLAKVEAAQLADNVLVLMPAQAGSVAGALDASSPLAAALAKHLAKSREPAGALLEAVGREVEQQSGGRQKPWFVAGQPAMAAAWPPLDQRSFLDSQQPREGAQPGQEWINASGMVFCWCPPGKFMMGTSDAERPAFDDARTVEVTLPKGFWMAKYEAALIEGQRAGWGPQPSLARHPLAPMHNLSQENPKKFIDLLTKAEQQAGRLPSDWEYALPTEAEWEYACRAGTTTRFSFGHDAGQLFRFANYADRRLLADNGAMQFADAWFDDGVGQSLAPVGSYQPNAWGLHDMHGNVAEWCADRYLPRLLGGVNPLVDGTIKEAAGDGVIRGGAWCSTAEHCETAFRNSEFPGKQRDYIGFRVVLRKK